MTVREMINDIINKCDDLDVEVEVICTSFSPLQSVKEIEYRRCQTQDSLYICAE